MFRNPTRVLVGFLILAGFALPATLRGQRTPKIRTLTEQEMVDMISAQRAYELNSKAVKAADEMSETASQMIR